MEQNIFWKIRNICPLSELWLLCVWTLGKHLHRPQEPKVSPIGGVSPPKLCGICSPLSAPHHFAAMSLSWYWVSGKKPTQIQPRNSCLGILQKDINYLKHMFHTFSGFLFGGLHNLSSCLKNRNPFQTITVRKSARGEPKLFDH